ncbi:MAG: trypsin-like peptidase domain-containing protein [Planctomycetaceae bacterium]|nr:trypsin-like peptidase domain-containing protein [Planctomycetaceae bacterium]
MTARNSIATLIATGLIGALPLGAAAHAVSPHADGVVERHSEREGSRRQADALSRAFRDAARTLAPSVVTINTRGTANGEPRAVVPLPHGFRMPTPPAQPARGTGTGVVISRDGHIVTANHVVADAEEIELVFHDGRTATAKVVGLDPGSDIAVLKTDASGLVPAAFGDSDDLEVGEWVVALGAPFGLEQTLTAGIVSAKGRSDVGLAAFESYIQTDAAINPGNSGGPLANLDGEIVGINSAISSRGGGNDGIGFSVPSSVVRRVEPGDVITGVAGRSVRTPGELVATIGSLPPGDEIDVRMIRDGDARTLRATLAERADAPDAGRAPMAPKAAPAPIERLGLSLRALAASDAATLGLEGDAGALVVESVEPAGAAERAGIRAGDVVRRIGSRPVATLADAQAAVAAISARAAVPMLVEREGQPRFVLVERGAASDTDR